MSLRTTRFAFLISRTLLILGSAYTSGCAYGVPIPRGDDLDDAGDAGDRRDDPSEPEDWEPEPPPAGVSVLYVAPHGSNENEGDRPLAPLRSIQYGIQQARLCEPEPCALHLAVGEYSGALTLVRGVHLRGGYLSDFSGLAGDHQTTLITSEVERTVRAEGLKSLTEIENLTLRGADQSAKRDGRSTIALFVARSDAHLALIDVVVEGGRAASGPDGRNGSAAACEAKGGRGGIATSGSCDFSAPDAGAAGGNPIQGGAPGANGKSQNCGNATCPAVGSDGIGDGSPGSPGGNGAPVTAATAAAEGSGSFSGTAWVPAEGTPATRGEHGTGGGGGGAGGTKRIAACFGCGSLLGGRGGDGGAGGCGGGPGESGTPGGASFGIVISESEVSYAGLRVVGGVGGDGGNGGEGHPGMPGDADGSRNRQDRQSAMCGALNYHSGHGAVGGTGGAGGSGAGGAGGPAFGIVRIGSNAKILARDGSPEMITLAGSAGKGGARRRRLDPCAGWTRWARRSSHEILGGIANDEGRTLRRVPTAVLSEFAAHT